jgi:hypothetical protein
LPQHMKQQANAKDVVKMYQPHADSTKGEWKWIV